MRRIIFIILLVICCINSSAQTVFKIYFEYGKSTPKENQLQNFDEWFINLDFTKIDSITLVGFADSVGKIENNIKLSLKRTEFVRKYIQKKYVGQRFRIYQYGKGEKRKKIEDKDRRVEVKVWLSADFIPQEIDTATKEISSVKCYLVDNEMLQACFISYVKIKNKNYAKLYIENEDYFYYKKTKYFYITRDSGKTFLNKVKWTPKNSGNLTFKRQRYETLIPKESFLANKIVYYETRSCDSCFRDSIYGTGYKIGDSCMANDIFLSRNLEWRPKFFNMNYIKIRVPKMFTDSSLIYYEGGGPTINWIKKRKKSAFKYATFRTQVYSNQYHFQTISRKRKCCNIRWDWYPGRPNICCCCCGGDWSFPSKTINLEIGVNRLKSINTPYVGLNYYFELGKYDGRFLTGIDTSALLLFTVKIQRPIISVPLKLINPFHYVWKSARNTSINQDNLFECIIGAEVRTGFFKANSEFGELNVFGGLRFTYGNNRIFIHEGASFRYFGLYSRGLYSNLQFGFERLLFR